jgi:hypothetical protein
MSLVSHRPDSPEASEASEAGEAGEAGGIERDRDTQSAPQQAAAQSAAPSSARPAPAASARGQPPAQPARPQPQPQPAEAKAPDAEQAEADEGALVWASVPPEPLVPVAADTRRKVDAFREAQRAGFSFHAQLLQTRDFHNPAMLEQFIERLGIAQYASNMAAAAFDPGQWGEADSFKALQQEQERLAQRREEELRKRDAVAFVAGGTQAAPPLLTAPGLSAPASASQSRRPSRWDSSGAK